MASIYGEDVSTYKDMQDMDYLLKKTGYNDNPERAVYLLELALKAIRVPSDEDHPNDNFSHAINAVIFNNNPISKEIKQHKMAEIIENLNQRFEQNDSKMTEIGNKIVPMADAPNPEKAKLWQQFHLHENEQTSILKITSKLEDIRKSR